MPGGLIYWGAVCLHLASGFLVNVGLVFGWCDSGCCGAGLYWLLDFVVIVLCLCECSSVWVVCYFLERDCVWVLMYCGGCGCLVVWVVWFVVAVLCVWFLVVIACGCFWIVFFWVSRGFVVWFLGWCSFVI